MASEPSARITIRPASEDDRAALERLAQLDSAWPPPPAPALVAEIDGEPAAAISLHDGTVVADPFRPTAHLVALLEVHAAAERAPARARGRFRRPAAAAAAPACI